MSTLMSSQRLHSPPTATKSEPIRSCFAHSRPPATPCLSGEAVQAAHLVAHLTALAPAAEAALALPLAEDFERFDAEDPVAEAAD